MRVFLSVDMEGVAGVSDWDQCRPGAPGYAEGCRLMLGETNAAIAGAVDGGATEVVVNDAHGLMANLAPDGLRHRARYLSGRHKTGYMMAGLDSSCAAVVFVGYHGAMSGPSVLSHTYNPRAVSEVRLAGRTTGEAGINALVAAAHGVPVVCITGDQLVGPEAEPFCPGVRAVQVKESLGRGAALSLHPDQARELIRQGVAEAVASAASVAPPPVPGSVQVDWLTTDLAEQAAWVRGVARTGPRTTQIEVTDPLAAYGAFVASLWITRGRAETS